MAILCNYLLFMLKKMSHNHALISPLAFLTISPLFVDRFRGSFLEFD